MNLICKKYRRIRKIGMGTFCNVYLAKDLEEDAEVAIKMDKNRSEVTPSLLTKEYNIYTQLKGCSHIPHIFHFGQESGYNVLVMSKLGPSLEDLLNLCSRQLSLKTILMLVDQMMMVVKSVHMRNVIHCDLKPENFVMGVRMQHKSLFLIDFGLSRKYYSSSSRTHIPYRNGKNLVGTARYASLNAHKGIVLSRRDDMESLGYMMVYLHRGKLPWQGLQGMNKVQRYEQILEMKLSTSIAVLCTGLPTEFAAYLRYCRNMTFEQKPNYRFWQVAFRELLRSLNLQYDLAFDWNGLIPPQTTQPKNMYLQMKANCDEKN